jgi:hypothetical protein
MRLAGAALLLAVGVAACGGGGGGSPPPPVPVTTHTVTLNWQANRESGVNLAGGGYLVTISGQPTIVVPFAGGQTATSTVVSLDTGSYAVTVRAFAALDLQGGNTGNASANSQVLIVNVP